MKTGELKNEDINNNQQFISCNSKGIDYDELSKQIKIGDIIFHKSRSRQSKFLDIATGSSYTHCGVIIKENGKYQVLEAVQPVKITPLMDWIDRGLHSEFIISRYYENISKNDMKNIIEAGKSHLNKDYDTKFLWDDNKMYCSEIVWKMFNKYDYKLCELRQLKDYSLVSDIIKKELKRRYGNNIPYEEQMVAPVDLLLSEKLDRVYKQ